MFEFILFGSMVWFWIVFGVWALILFVSVETDRPGVATITSLAFFGVFAYWGALPGGGGVLATLAANPFTVALLLVGFFVLGTVWAVVKWWFYVRRLAEKRREQLEAGDVRYGKIKKPSVSENKSRIMTWMCFWPFSFIWTMIDDPVRMVFKAIYTKIRGLLQRIADRAFEGLEEPDPTSRYASSLDSDDDHPLG
jgi:hypothetical protein